LTERYFVMEGERERTGERFEHLNRDHSLNRMSMICLPFIVVREENPDFQPVLSLLSPLFFPAALPLALTPANCQIKDG
jgi:hypothetical protein